jgi:hypothetical protein
MKEMPDSLQRVYRATEIALSVDIKYSSAICLRRELHDDG